MAETAAAPGPGPQSTNPVDLLRQRSYLVILFLGALIGVPVACVAYFFLKFVSEAQQYLFVTLPPELGFAGVPAWWPVAPLVVAGVIVSASIHYLPGTSGHKPAEGFKAGGIVNPIELPGIILASLATLCLGVVLGPEAPLIAIGGGLGVLAVHLLKKDAPPMAVMVIGAAGSFAAISTLLGNPIVGAFLLMEAAGLGGPLLGVVLVPGLLAAGVGSLIFIGLDSWTGFGSFSISVPGLPAASTPTAAEFAWAIGIGVVAAALGSAIKRGSLALQPVVERRILALTPVVGLAVAGVIIGFTELTGHPANAVLFSGQSALPTLVLHTAGWTVGALVALIVAKALAYGLSLSSFRGGPIFPGMFIGAALGVTLSHLPGLTLVAGVGMGIGAMTVAMLGLPLTSVLLAALVLGADGVKSMPLIIVAVVVAYVASVRLAPTAPDAAAAPATSPAPAPAGSAAPSAAGG